MAIANRRAADTVRILPLDTDVVVALHALPESFHGDPTATSVCCAPARSLISP
jgi:hypothetical protein